MRWALDEGEDALAVEIASTFWEFLYLHGDVSEGRAWLTETLERADETPTEARALVLAGAGWLASGQGDGRATALLEDALRCAQVASPATRAYVMTMFGRQVLTEDRERARTLSQEAVSLARTTEDRWLLAIALNNFAEVLRTDGDHERATALYEEAYQIGHDIGDHFHSARFMLNLGEMAHIGGDLVRARELLSQVQELADQRGDDRHLAFALLDLGWVSLAEGRYGESEQRFRKSLSLLREMGGLPFIPSVLTGLAAVAAARGDEAKAGHLVGAADELEARVGALSTPSDAGVHEPYLAGARARAADRWDQYRAEGRRMELDTVLTYAAG